MEMFVGPEANPFYYVSQILTVANGKIYHLEYNEKPLKVPNHFQIIEEVILISLAEDNGSNAKDINDFCNSSSSMWETVIELGLDNKSALSGVSLFSMIEGHCSYE